MYWPDSATKKNPARQWAQPDRTFFGFGACHILAGVFLELTPDDSVYGEWIIPNQNMSGNHMFVTNGHITFDFHGYSNRDQLLARYWERHQSRDQQWDARVVKIDFPLLDTVALNARGHRGPDQYFGDPIPRAQRFIQSKKCTATR